MMISVKIVPSSSSCSRKLRAACCSRGAAVQCKASTYPEGRSVPPAELGAVSRRALALSGAALLVAATKADAKLVDYNLVPDAPVEEVSMVLGTTDGHYMFTPSTVEFTQGRITKLKLSNPSTSTHYFTALEFSDKIFSILVLAGDPAVEVKGAIREVALKAGASATWVFIPIKVRAAPLALCAVRGNVCS
ncbi:hypothetical protein TSOC_012168 [Tetrabaena socialis]|uniref:Uncharacterized protein n=1 Tax=Tetrabaena socialis TaxID=47790 RepID=A0A2J7ZNQ3_9CHLO|nr:hypothetical protein TSOC_012168 [Tetrabaena socialis]|eukprot:PNH01899.1 hypothetical protein TSOC_012168 [Tetrabaena socialis]